MCFFYLRLLKPADFLVISCMPSLNQLDSNQWIHTSVFHTAYSSAKHLPLYAQELYGTFRLLAFIEEKENVFNSTGLVASNIENYSVLYALLHAPVLMVSMYANNKKKKRCVLCCLSTDVHVMMDSQSSLFAWLKVTACYIRGH